MNRGRAIPESPDSWAWCEACSDRLQEQEPRLKTADADEFAARLWLDEAARDDCPVRAADRFLAEPRDD